MSTAAEAEKRESGSDEIELEEHHRNHSVASHAPPASAADRVRRNANAKLANPLAGFNYEQLKQRARAYAMEHAIADTEDVRALEIGACLAKNPQEYNDVAKHTDLTSEELAILEKEYTSRWSQPKLLYLVIVLCSTCAAVQGMGMRPPLGVLQTVPDRFLGRSSFTTLRLLNVHISPSTAFVSSRAWTVVIIHGFNSRWSTTQSRPYVRGHHSQLFNASRLGRLKSCATSCSCKLLNTYLDNLTDIPLNRAIQGLTIDLGV